MKIVNFDPEKSFKRTASVMQNDNQSLLEIDSVDLIAKKFKNIISSTVIVLAL